MAATVRLDWAIASHLPAHKAHVPDVGAARAARRTEQARPGDKLTTAPSRIDPFATLSATLSGNDRPLCIPSVPRPTARPPIPQHNLRLSRKQRDDETGRDGRIRLGPVFS